MVNKSLGQHWLKNRVILDEIAELAGDGELCVEIGPGLGTLTSSLLRRFNKVIAVEFDQKLADNLPKSFPGKNLVVVNEDILKYDFNQLDGLYAVAGNIPYYITSPIIEKLLTAPKKPTRIVLLIQKEVAERIIDEKETVLSLFVKNRARASLGPVVKKNEFTPPPKVDSQVIVLEPFQDGPIYEDEVFETIKLAFKAPRKKLIHNLVNLKSRDELKNIFNRLGIDLNARPADLHIEDYYNLHQSLK